MRDTTAELTIRAAGPEDRLAVCTLLQQAWHSAGGARWDQLDALGESCAALLARRGSQTVGFGLFDLRTAPAVSLSAVAIADREPVDAAWQALWPAAEQYLAGRGARSVHYVGEAPWLLEILGQAGFQRVGVLVNYEKIQIDSELPAGHSGVRLLPVRPADLDLLAEIDRACFDPLWHYPRPMLEAAMQQAARLTAAELDRRLVGYQLSAQEGREGQVVRLAVLPEYRRRGIASRLLADALASFRRGRVRRLSLTTQGDNLPAQRLYERFGFQRTGEELSVLHKDIGA
jgi:ribosomal-protein-alanine N-acetyltransferase